MVYRDRREYHPLSFGSRHFGESIDSGSPGRLSQSTEAGAGKRQIFAIGNFVNQRVLKPLHDFLMDTLRSIPMDGTFNQLRPCNLQQIYEVPFLRSVREKVYPGQRFTWYAILGDDVCIADENVASLYRQTVACFQAGPAARKRSLPVLTWISGDGIRRPEATSSRGRSLALGDRLAVSLERSAYQARRIRSSPSKRMRANT
ncbi:hypothetical protein VNO78_35198 [Psophocarpus tetragonolobus]|uniref:Uncharacterized protein n=1 Tax=Psophocarpus tetragonolobus TaxID=3891 RepID=A0AAN9NS35_PSOTE